MSTDATAPPDLYGGEPSVYDDPGYGVDGALDAFAQPDAMPVPVNQAELAAHHVTAVLVAHNGDRWLPQALAALTASDHRPDRIVAVDTGSRDESEKLLIDALGGPAITRMPKRTGFGAAVQHGLAYADQRSPIRDSHRQRTEWVWLLHDDCAPAPGALRQLLECAVRRPDAAVIGPKVLGWRDDRQLLEVGLTITGGGRRHTGLEKREYDQGQHDATREVLAVGSAGMLVRRDIWEDLGGFDRNLAVFRDDVDFGWRANQAGHTVLVCPRAVVHHAEAAAHGRRRLGATRDRPHMVDRRNALYVLLANAPARRWLLALVRIVISSVVRAVGFLLGKQPALAFEELVAVLAVLGRPDRLIRARLARSRTRSVDPATLRRFFPSTTQQLRNAGEQLFAVVTGTDSGHDLPSRRRAVTDPASEDDEPDADDTSWLKVFVRPPVLLVAGLTLLTLLASRRLIGGGRLSGGALFPAPGSAAELWATYTEAWHGVGVGSPIAAPPYLAVIAAFGSVVQSPSLAVDLLLLGSVPLAALTAYLLLRRVVESPWLRFWGAAVYGLLPATTGAIAAGRLGTAVAAVVTPLVALAVWRTLGTPDRPGPFRAAWSAGLLLAIVAAFVPLAWLAAVAAGVAAVAAGFRSTGAVLRLVAMVSVAPVVLAPWTLELVRNPELLLLEAGVPGPDLSEPALVPWSVLLMNPGGPGAAPIWLGAGIVLAAWAALFRTGSRGPIVAGWIVAAVGLVAGLLVSRMPVSGPTLETPVSGWPGYATVLVGGGLMVAAVQAAARLRTRLSGVGFGWRQPVAVLLVLAAGATPLVGAGWWLLRGADDPLERRSPAVLPAYVAEEGERPARIRTLVLSRADDGRITYALLRHAGPRLGDAETGPPPEQQTALEEYVGDLVSGRGGADATALADFAARYIYIPAPADPALVDVLDTVPGLTRASAPPEAAMWQVAGEVARVRVLGGAEGAIALASEEVEASDTVPADPDADQRLLVLAEHTDPGWRATLDGQPLTPTTYQDWAQAFELPNTGGEVAVMHRGEERRTWLTVQLVAVLVAILLALPGMRRQRGAVEGAAEISPDESSSPDLPVAPVRRRARTGAAQPAAPEPVAPEPALPVARPGETLPMRRRARRPEQVTTRQSDPAAAPYQTGPAPAVPESPPGPVEPVGEYQYPPGSPAAPPYATATGAEWPSVAADQLDDEPAELAGGRRRSGRRARRGSVADVADYSPADDSPADYSPADDSPAADQPRPQSRSGRRTKGRRRRGGES
jgi:GT2 family glycosyltransferase